jgi:hypothetical protein
MILLADIPQYLNQTITTLEHYSEPEAWIKIIGPRLFAMLTRYLNNDVVIVGFGVYAYCKCASYMIFFVYEGSTTDLSLQPCSMMYTKSCTKPRGTGYSPCSMQPS